MLFITGLVKMIFDNNKINLKSIFSGILLGIPNYFSIYFVLKSLDELGGIVVFPVLNIGVVLLSTIISFIYYKEQMSLLNWMGISMSCISIILILSVWFLMTHTMKWKNRVQYIQRKRK